MKIIIDAGHGGKDPGGGNNQYWLEKDKNLEISLYQYQRLKELGINVVLTRANDVYLEPLDRTRIVRESESDICISNHINACGADGAEVIHSIHNDGKLAITIAEEIKAEGQNIRRVFCKSSTKDLNKDYYYMHRLTGSVQTLIIEYGFADSTKDDVEQIKNNWKSYAEAVVRAVCKYASLQYEAPKKEVEEGSWKYEALQYLNSIDVLDDIEGWKSIIDEPMPVWAVAILFKKIHENLRR